MFHCTDPVLIVDDQPKLALLVTELLHRLGLPQVESTSDVDSALEKLRATKYGLVICDLDMRPKDGLELLREIRSDRQLYRTPFILTETTITFDQVSLAHSMGADAFLLKPFDLALFKSKLNVVLSRTPRKRSRGPAKPLGSSPSLTSIINSYDFLGQAPE
jgi:two-component system, chemotaxis family, chemotaxis protein CheY